MDTDITPAERSFSVNVRLSALAEMGASDYVREVASAALAELDRLHAEVERLRKVEAAAVAHFRAQDMHVLADIRATRERLDEAIAGRGTGA